LFFVLTPFSFLILQERIRQHVDPLCRQNDLFDAIKEGNVALVRDYLLVNPGCANLSESVPPVMSRACCIFPARSPSHLSSTVNIVFPRCISPHQPVTSYWRGCCSVLEQT
jgi:hypothetical protein